MTSICQLYNSTELSLALSCCANLLIWEVSMIARSFSSSKWSIQLYCLFVVPQVVVGISYLSDS